jgi:hypothetical protein
MRGKAVGKFPGMVLRDLLAAHLSLQPRTQPVTVASPRRQGKTTPDLSHTNHGASRSVGKQDGRTARPPGGQPGAKVAATIAAAEYRHASMCTAARPVPVCHRRRRTEIGLTSLGRTGTANRLALTDTAREGTDQAGRRRPSFPWQYPVVPGLAPPFVRHKAAGLSAAGQHGRGAGGEVPALASAERSMYGKAGHGPEPMEHCAACDKSGVVGADPDMSSRVDVVPGSQAASDPEHGPGVGPALHPGEPTPYPWPPHNYLELRTLPTAMSVAGGTRGPVGPA